MIDFVVLSVPMPPSVNKIYPGDGKRRWKSADYKAWLDLAHISAKQHNAWGKLVEGPVSVVYNVPRRNDRRREDIGNFEKALSDFLVAAEIIEDDSKIEDLRLRYVSDRDRGEGVLIEVRKIRDE